MKDRKGVRSWGCSGWSHPGPGQGFLAQTVASTEVGGWAWSLEKTMGPNPHCAGTRQGRMLGEPHPQGKNGRVGGGKLLLLRDPHLSYCEVRGDVGQA